MSFRNHIIPTKNRRKETDSLRFMNHLEQERASAFTSKGVITLEAAVVIPIFFFAILCMVYLFEIMAIQTSIRSALQNVGKELAEEAYLSPIISQREVKEKLIRTLEDDFWSDSMIAGGSDGLNCSHSKSNLRTSVIDLNVRYQIEIPVLMFRLPVRTYEERLRVKGWTGYVEGSGDSAEDDLVYVTNYGTVYHKSLSCTYLELTIRPITKDKLWLERNESGAIYSPCGKCGDLSSGTLVYITDYGKSYHTTLDCSGLKRTINVVWLSEINGLGGCSKCVK